MEPTDIRTRLRDVTEDGPPGQRQPSLAAASAASPVQPTTQVLPPSAFRSGQPEEALQDSLGYGLYARAAEDGREPARVQGEPATRDMIARYRAQATADLHAFAFRYLHNHAEQIRQDAIREHLGRMRRPPGLLKLVLASAVGFALAWTAMHTLLPMLEAQGGIAAIAEGLSVRLRSLGG